MGPKKKGGKKSNSSASAADIALDKVYKPPAPFKVSRQLDQEKIDFLTDRVKSLITNNDSLRNSTSRNEKDTHDIVLYFQRELEMKDDIVNRLNENLVQRETQLKFEVESLTKKFDADHKSLKVESEKRIEELEASLGSRERELQAIDTFRREKAKYEETMSNLELQLERLREQMVMSLDNQERKFLEEKAQIFRDIDAQKSAFREIALKEAKERMGSDYKSLISDNDRMHEELKFHQQVATDLSSDKTRLEGLLVRANREISLQHESEKEFARQGLLKSKEIKALRERVEQLEKQQIVNIERFRHRTKELKGTVHKELEEATLDAASLRHLISIKNKELRSMKSLAAAILAQRGEVEQFFLESLDEVKEMVRKEKKVSSQGSRNTRSIGGGPKVSGGTFPSIKAKHAEAGPDINLDDKVGLSDLNWNEKELVLRVLFAKMNGLANVINKQLAPKKGGFVSEVNLPVEENDAFQNAFEVN